jgi:Recombination endonuclease VII
MSDTIPQADSPRKQCTGPCGRLLPATTEFFHRNKSAKDGLRAQCKVCKLKYGKLYRSRPETILRRSGRVNLRSKYGISKEEYNLILFRQGGVCAICKKAESAIDYKTKKAKLLAVDHNHVTGQIRELLCQRCNWIVGYIERDRERAQKILKYLKKHDT